jgi:hypothetical protein
MNMSGRRKLGLAMVFGLIATLAVADRATGQEAGKLIDEATSAFVALDFEGSLKKLDAALRVPGNRPADLVRIHGQRALCFLSLGRNSEAQKAFAAALSIDPAFRLGQDVSPRFSEPFKKILDQGVPTLRISVSPPDSARKGEPVTVAVKLVADPANLSDSLMFHYRRTGTTEYASEQVRLVRGKRLRFMLSAGAPLDWYYEVLDRHGGRLRSKGDADHPLHLKVKAEQKIAAVTPEPPPEATAATPAWYQRWWVWAIVGSVAAAAGTYAVILASSEGEAASHRDFSIDIR